MLLIKFLCASLTATLGFLVFTWISKYRPRYKGEVEYDPRLPIIRRWFQRIIGLLFFQLSCWKWDVYLLGLPVMEPWMQQVSETGGAMVILGILLYQWALFPMKQHLLPPGSKAPRDEAVLLRTGPFRFSRNPMYLSYLLTFNGIQLLTLSPLVVFSLVLFRKFETIIEKEENDQLELHYDHFATYKQKTPRWFSLRRFLYLY